METSSRSEEHNAPLYNPFDAMSFSYDRCFLCGKSLEGQQTVEHVFPRWLLNRFNLWNHKLVLLNGTEISYRQLTIPCCATCNNEHLSTLEQALQRGVEGGYLEFTKIDELMVHQWMSKIFYGLLFKELSLSIDRENPHEGTITSPELLERYRTAHWFLQSVRLPLEFSNFFPGSIFIFQIHTYGDERDFDYHDGLAALTFSIRMGEVGVVASLQDNGAQKEVFAEYYERIRKITLHPIQFDEFSAKIAYQATVMNRVPKYLSVIPESETNVSSVVTLPLAGLSTKPIFDEWNQRRYAMFLAQYLEKWELTFEDLFQEPDLVMSFLENEDGQVIQLDAEGNLVEPVD